MKVLVLGGTGFVGPHVVRGLVAAGHEVTLFNRGRSQAVPDAEVAHIHGDRAHLPAFAGAFRRLAPEVVLDMRPFTEDDALDVETAFRGIARRVVAVSSMDVYRAYGRLRGSEPGPPDPLPLTEDAPLRGRLFPYRSTDSPPPRVEDDPRPWLDHYYDKIPVERVVLGDPDLPGTVLRLPMVYGPHDEQHRLFPYLKRMDDRRLAIVLGETQARFRGTRGYVENVGAAIALAVADDRAAGHVYNVGDADPPTEAGWVRAIGRAAAWDGRLVIVPDERLPAPLRPKGHLEQHWVTETTRLRRDLGYTEPVSQAAGLHRAVEWERANPPPMVDPREFDYAAEDELLATLEDGQAHDVGRTVATSDGR
jgi:nucleoside-diphosphate-sugar epimerase